MQTLLTRVLPAAAAVLTALATVQWLFAERPQPGPSSVTVGDGTTLAYETHGSGSRTMVMVHGSPGGRTDFQGLKNELAERYTMYIFDMPGFGESSRWVPDYGYDAGAEYLAEAINELGIAPVIATGFSWGGGVAIMLAARFPDVVTELLLINAVGVADGFHTGIFLTEYARYLAAAPSLLLYPGSVAPGLMPFADRHGFWRSFLDSDTRRVERTLPRVRVPTTIIHAEHDTVVGPAAARRHHELIPNSRLVWYDGNHGWIYRRYDELAQVIREAMRGAP